MWVHEAFKALFNQADVTVHRRVAVESSERAASCLEMWSLLSTSSSLRLLKTLKFESTCHVWQLRSREAVRTATAAGGAAHSFTRVTTCTVGLTSKPPILGFCSNSAHPVRLADGVAGSRKMDDGRYPELIAFDLDYTLWDFWIDTHVDPPLKQDALSGAVYDSADDPTRVEFYQDVPEILRALKNKPEITVAAASRTFATKLITGIPYSEMLFFDDELRNREVEKQLGVTFVFVRDGVTWGCFRKGLREWRKRHATDDSASS
ncbi:acid phosphatase-domain-containing protein [Boletus coccyginus]|nr:acid phosphatase-domain-containing protein [Boletus coccyginus]